MGSVRARLSVMMFLQYFVWGGWGVSIGGYMGDALKFTPNQIGWIFSTTALGAMISPLFVGYFADRYFSTERILAALHLAGGVLLILAGQQAQVRATHGDHGRIRGVLHAHSGADQFHFVSEYRRP